jgi:hypothetical protein
VGEGVEAGEEGGVGRSHKRSAGLRRLLFGAGAPRVVHPATPVLQNASMASMNEVSGVVFGPV